MCVETIHCLIKWNKFFCLLSIFYYYLFCYLIFCSFITYWPYSPFLIVFILSTDTWTFHNFVRKTTVERIYFYCYAECANYYILLHIRNILHSLQRYIFYTEKMLGADLLIYFFATAGRIFTLWDKLVTLYERVSIRLPLQCIKRYVVAVCLMHHIRPCSFRCRYVFMFCFESFYSFESGWKCGSESPEFSSFYLVQGIRWNIYKV